MNVETLSLFKIALLGTVIQNIRKPNAIIKIKDKGESVTSVRNIAIPKMTELYKNRIRANIQLFRK